MFSIAVAFCVLFIIFSDSFSSFMIGTMPLFIFSPYVIMFDFCCIFEKLYVVSPSVFCIITPNVNVSNVSFSVGGMFNMCVVVRYGVSFVVFFRIVSLGMNFRL